MQPSATKVVVADTGPLIALGRLDLLNLLGRLFAQVHVPRDVLAECVVKPERADAQRIQSALAEGRLLLCDAQPIEAPGLDIGERAAMGRALELGAVLLADDLAARQQAHALGLPVIGTLGVLVRAKQQGLVPEVRPLIEMLRNSGQRLGHTAVGEALRAAGEQP